MNKKVMATVMERSKRTSSWQQKARTNSGWHRGLVEWKKDEKAYISVVFSWQLQEAYSRAVWYKNQGYLVRVGGPAVKMAPDFFRGIADVSGSLDALPRHNSNATFTSRGCIRCCSFCIVPKIEGDLVELANWPVRPIICDNNLLACSRIHFDKVIDKLKLLSGIDFNQGLDARLLTKYHAQRLAELDLKCIRLAWDHVKLEHQFGAAFSKLVKAGISPRMIWVYVLIGFNDTPEDALYRFRTIRNMGALSSPMRYQPLDAGTKNNYVAPSWTEAELHRYVWYWSNQRYVSKIPFEKFSDRNRKLAKLLRQGRQPRLL